MDAFTYSLSRGGGPAFVNMWQNSSNASLLAWGFGALITAVLLNTLVQQVCDIFSSSEQVLEQVRIDYAKDETRYGWPIEAREEAKEESEEEKEDSDGPPLTRVLLVNASQKDRILFGGLSDYLDDIYEKSDAINTRDFLVTDYSEMIEALDHMQLNDDGKREESTAAPSFDLVFDDDFRPDILFATQMLHFIEKYPGHIVGLPPVACVGYNTLLALQCPEVQVEAYTQFVSPFELQSLPSLSESLGASDLLVANLTAKFSKIFKDRPIVGFQEVKQFRQETNPSWTTLLAGTEFAPSSSRVFNSQPFQKATDVSASFVTSFEADVDENTNEESEEEGEISDLDD